MTDLEFLLNRARDGDLEAFGAIVKGFQDMAVGYAYSILYRFRLVISHPNPRDPKAVRWLGGWVVGWLVKVS
ncbi:hypothetical protein HYR99_27395 [Candidatus Poribacteria bacterium]|nr:hypothetical protein [Candidatus Poribacteria bacterium]